MRELEGHKGKADPGAAPQTADYSAKTGQGAGIMALMDELIGDLKLEAQKTHGEHTDELAAIDQKIAALHDECDFLLANMDLRKKARVSELDAMRNALSILSGADFSFRQGLRAG